MTSGLDIIREALLARKGNLAVLARDVGVSASALDDFAQGNRETLPVIISTPSSPRYGTVTSNFSQSRIYSAR